MPLKANADKRNDKLEECEDVKLKHALCVNAKVERSKIQRSPWALSGFSENG